VKKSNKNSLKSLLVSLDIIREKNLEIFSYQTRDNKNLRVYKDVKSNVIFIDKFYVGEQEYKKALYKKKKVPLLDTTKRTLEQYFDEKRRFERYIPFIANKKICDFGCGAGGFLKQSLKYAEHVQGIEIEEELNVALNKSGIECYNDINQIKENLDTFFLFHSFEHLPNPLDILKNIYKKLKKNKKGKIIIEVPHSRDFLLDYMAIESFKNFTLWSQHLILHTRSSLKIFLKEAGFKNIIIEGVQRYSIDNHLNWMINNKPAGHKELLSILKDKDIEQAYSNALSRIDANDTLVAIATT
tara:strand:+ start:1985 stop:2881 length:897 start_codon:yes stop_codon:yes gene_type:complete